MQKVNITVRGQSQQIVVNYHAEEDLLDELKARAQAFMAALQPDDLLRRISQKVLA